MKRVLAFLLIVCLFTCGCTAPQEQEILPEVKNEITGQWISVVGEYSLDILDDGTGQMIFGDETTPITWEFDHDQNCYVITGEMSCAVQYEAVDSIELMTVDNIDFCRADDLEEAFAILQQDRQEYLDALISNTEKLELNSDYAISENVFIRFTEITLVEDGEVLSASYTLTNYSSETLEQPFCAETSMHFFIAEQPRVCVLGSVIQFEYPVEPLQSVTGSVNLCALYGVVESTVQAFGAVPGVVLFKLYGRQVYLDLSDYFVL